MDYYTIKIRLCYVTAPWHCRSSETRPSPAVMAPPMGRLLTVTAGNDAQPCRASQPLQGERQHDFHFAKAISAWALDQVRGNPIYTVSPMRWQLERRFLGARSQECRSTSLLNSAPLLRSEGLTALYTIIRPRVKCPMDGSLIKIACKQSYNEDCDLKKSHGK